MNITIDYDFRTRFYKIYFSDIEKYKIDTFSIKESDIQTDSFLKNNLFSISTSEHCSNEKIYDYLIEKIKTYIGIRSIDLDLR